MAVRPHEIIADKTKNMESAVHAAIDAIEDYRDTCAKLIDDDAASDDPNEKLQGRLGQFVKRSDQMVASIEDDVLTPLNFLLDRLFSVKMAEDGEFI